MSHERSAAASHLQLPVLGIFTFVSRVVRTPNIIIAESVYYNSISMFGIILVVDIRMTHTQNAGLLKLS